MLNVTSLREQVYQYLREEMIAGRLPPGSTINPTELSERLGISKTPLRDALIRMETEGFVTILPRKGVMVNPLTPEDVRNTYEIIGALESRVILDIFDRIDEAHIKELERLNEDMRRSLTDGNFDMYYQGNLDFHDVYLNLSDNRDIQRLIAPMKQRLYDFPRRSYIEEWELTNCDEHDRFIEAVKAGDAKAAAGIMRDVHWSYPVQEKWIKRFYSAVAKQFEADQE